MKICFEVLIPLGTVLLISFHPCQGGGCAVLVYSASPLQFPLLSCWVFLSCNPLSSGFGSHAPRCCACVCWGLSGPEDVQTSPSLEECSKGGDLKWVFSERASGKQEMLIFSRNLLFEILSDSEVASVCLFKSLWWIFSLPVTCWFLSHMVPLVFTMSCGCTQELCLNTWSIFFWFLSLLSLPLWSPTPGPVRHSK